MITELLTEKKITRPVHTVSNTPTFIPHSHKTSPLGQEK